MVSKQHSLGNSDHNVSIIFFGTDQFSIVSLRSLVEAGYNIAAVVTKPDSKVGRGQRTTYSAVKQYALETHIPVWQPVKVSEINSRITELGTNVAGILVSFGKIIPQSTIDLFKPGIINVHPSLLPKYRGPTPIESAIENGDDKTGVSIMKLTSEMDEGPIYGQAIYNLAGNETQPELYDGLAKVGANKLLELLPNILDGSLESTPQDRNQVTYCGLLSKDDAWLKPTMVSAKIAEQIVRAHLKYPRTKIKISEQTIIITKAHVSYSPTSPLDIVCNNNEYLTIDELIAPSGRNMTSRAFLNGYKIS